MNDDEIFIRLDVRALNGDRYTITFFSRELRVTVSRNAAAVGFWINHVRRNYRFSRVVLSLGVLSRPSSFGQESPPAVLQICISNHCLVFQILRADSIPDQLVQFLADPRFTFIVWGSPSDLRLLENHFGLRVRNVVDLRDILGMENVPMEEMAERFLGFHGVERPLWISSSEWDAWMLDAMQVQYAAVDAYIALKLGLLFLIR